jgi:hypothetical protein
VKIITDDDPSMIFLWPISCKRLFQDIGKKNMNKEMHREHDLNDPNFYNLSKNKCCEILRF